LQRVVQWARENGVETSKICDYDGFRNLLEKYIETTKKQDIKKTDDFER